MTSPYGPYTLVEELATGGMAKIHLAEESETGRLVVVKHALPDILKDANARASFYDEARLAATLVHANIVRVLDIKRVASDGFYVMEYLDGEDVARLLTREVRNKTLFPIDLAVKIAIDIADALHFAHNLTDACGEPLGIVHRDVSPSNIRVTLDGQSKLLDFGIARSDMVDRAVTSAGRVKGKLAYMSPEQFGGTVDRRSDVFSLGAVLYEMTTTSRLFRRSGDKNLRVMRRILKEAVAPPSQLRADYPPELERIVLKALAKKPRDRYQSAEEFGRDLCNFASSSGIAVSNVAASDYVQRAGGVRGEADGEVTVATSSLDAVLAEDLPEATGDRPRLGEMRATAVGSGTFQPRVLPLAPPPVMGRGVTATTSVDPSFFEPTVLDDSGAAFDTATSAQPDNQSGVSWWLIASLLIAMVATAALVVLSLSPV